LILKHNPSSLSDRIPPHLYFVGSAVFHYLGPSFAVLLFSHVSVSGVAWLRIVTAALVFLVWRKPCRAFRKTNRETRWLIVALGVVFAGMNYSFYIAIDRLPLGTVASIEFIGPILLALIGTRTWRNLIALGLAVAGIYLLTDIRFSGEPIAFMWAFINAACFTLYIILAHRISKSDSETKPVDRLGAAMLFAALVITPLGIKGAIPALTDYVMLAAGFGVGISSSVIPYIFDQLAMAKLSRASYALFVALLPATAVIIGIIVLNQIPTSVEIGAVAMVIAGVSIFRQPVIQPERISN
jgi:inner membrane transporter RhtA